MNILQLEQESEKLKEKLGGGFSNQAKLLFIYHFFEKTLSTKNTNLIDSYLPEFIPGYIRLLNSWSVSGLKPRIHEFVIEQTEQIENSNLLKQSGFDSIGLSIEKMKEELKNLHRLLDRESIENLQTNKAFFHLLEEDASKEIGMPIGVLESVTIKINKTKNADKFIIIPSEKEIEEKINEQVKLSWINAIRTVKRYIRKVHPFHEVIISLDKKAGFCKGNSLGTALTLSFIEELLAAYNSPVSIKVGDRIAFTGGVNERGRITNTSDEIINQKTGLIFYSDIKLFVVPRDEEEKANEKLNDLKKESPQRDLRIIGIEDIGDLLNRRNIVEIKKQPIVLRSGKFLKKNWLAFAIVLPLLVILSIFIMRDFDTNPYSFTADTSKIYIKNKSGKILWAKNGGVPKQFVDEPNYLKGVAKIVDVASDGKNEVIISSVYNEPETRNLRRPLICYSTEGKIIWKYSFKDSVSSKKGILPTTYGIFIIDTLTLNKVKSLYAFAGNLSSFSSAIFRLELKTGKRLTGTFWCSGHIVNGIIKDINNDGKKDFLCVGVDNGYEDAVLFGIDIDTTDRVRPTLDQSLIRDYPIGDLISYIRFPKTDYDIYKNFRMPAPYASSFIDEYSQKYYQFFTIDFTNEFRSCLWYQVDYNLKDVNIVVDDRFRVMRDTLVAHHELPLPFTGTSQYIEMQKSKILYYKNGNWVNRKELE